jgi:MYXO-CTERM domain-containing protein
MGRRAKRSRRARAWTTTAASLALVASAAAWSSTTAASPSFPQQVDMDLSLPAMWVETMVAPKDGCLLCHLSEAGGLMTNNAFGLELKQNGAMAENVASLQGALLAVAASDPLAISDIKAGTNPNDDPKWLTRSTSTDPQPSYGCGSVSPGAPGNRGSAAILASVLAALVARGRRRKTDAGDRSPKLL